MFSAFSSFSCTLADFDALLMFFLFAAMYSPLMATSKRFKGLMKKMNNKLKQDLLNHEEMIKSLGALEQIISMATPRLELQETTDTAVALDVLNTSKAVDSGVHESSQECVDLTLPSEVTNNSYINIKDESPSPDVDFSIDESNSKIFID